MGVNKDRYCLLNSCISDEIPITVLLTNISHFLYLK